MAPTCGSLTARRYALSNGGSMNIIRQLMLRSAFLCVCMASAAVHAAPPGTIVYQGRLSDASGNPQNGSFNIEVRLYDVATAGSFLWNETQSVVVDDGFYSVTLGDTTPMPPELFAQRLWLGVNVNGDGEMTPRPALSAAPYAFRALTVMRNVVYVAADGTPVQNGNALKAALFAIQGNSADNGYTVFVDAGTFDLGTSTLILKPFVDLVGQGRDRTIIRSAAQTPTVQLAVQSSGVASMRVLATGLGAVGSHISAIEAPEAANGIDLRDLHVESTSLASTAGIRYGIRLGGTSNNRIENTIAIAHGGEFNYGIRSVSSGSNPVDGLVMRNVQGISRGASSGARGIDIAGTNNADLQDVTGRAEGSVASTTTDYIGLRFQNGDGLVARNVTGYAGGSDVVAAAKIYAVLVYYVNEAEFVGVTALAEGTSPSIGAMFVQAETQAYFDPALTYTRPRIFDAQLRALGKGTSNTSGLVVWGAAPLLERATVEARNPDVPGFVVALDVQATDYIANQPLSLQGPFEIRDSTFVQANALADSRGSGIHADGANLVLDNVRVEAQDAGIVIGRFQDPANPARSVVARNSSFITKRPTQAVPVGVHANATFRSAHGTFNSGVYVDPLGTAKCVASVHDLAEPLFIASGCP